MLKVTTLTKKEFYKLVTITRANINKDNRLVKRETTPLVITTAFRH